MKKRFTIILSIITALSLCGCNTEQQNSSPDSGKDYSTENSASDNSPGSEPSDSSSDSSSPEKEPEVISTFLIGLDGEAITTADIIEATDNDYKELSPSGMTEENFFSATVKGAYVAMPSGICRTSIDNPDVFDSENFVFTDVPAENKHDFIRVTEGDEICGLKVKKAVSRFNGGFANGIFGQNDDGTPLYGKDLGIPEIYFNSSELELEGAAELTGYIAIQPEDEYGIGAGEIKFIPSDCEVNLPVLYYDFKPFDGWICRPVGQVALENDIYFTNEYASYFFRLGNIDSAAADLSGVPSDGSFVKAKVTVENISMLYSLGGTVLIPVKGDITNITIL